MSIITETRSSDSPCVAAITRGWTVGEGCLTRPAEMAWHMVFHRQNDVSRLLIVGPWTQAGQVWHGDGGELLWIRFRLGTFMPHLPTRDFLNTELALPDASADSFYLKGAAWQFPDYENADTFVARLVHDEVLVCDPVVSAALHPAAPDRRMETPARTVRHRFLHATGHSQNHIRQMERAQQAAALLRQGVSILDTVEEAGYFDQPHLTRSLKQYIGYTPAQLLRQSETAMHSST